MAAERRDVRIVIAETRQALDEFEARLNEFSTALDDLEAETQRQRRGDPHRKGWM
ncbi:hypothetical protein [Nocardia sp. NPDC057030]|uniref:hypothetical protein n=1 Tax=unclassified Nocardia TaxID=2637762 RepID=UPI00363645B6